MLLLMMALAWMVYSLPIAWSGLRARVEPVFFCGSGTAFLAAVTAAILGLYTFDPITNFRLALNIRAAVLGLILLVVSYLYQRYKSAIFEGS